GDWQPLRTQAEKSVTPAEPSPTTCPQGRPQPFPRVLYTLRPRNPQSGSCLMPRFRRWLRWLLALFVALALAGAIAAGALYYIVSSKLPDVQSLREMELQEPMYVYASDGKLMAVFGETRRYPIEMKDVPERLKQAFLATEDARFYEHGGVDYKGIARAVWLLATTSDKRVPGGSTITQQEIGS